MKRLLSLGLFAAVTATPLLARAGDDAEVLYQRGRALMQQKRYAEACPALAKSVRLDPGIGALLWLGECYERDGQLAEAWRQFKAAERMAIARKDDRAKVAQRRAAGVEPKLTRLAILATAPEQEIKLDGNVVPASDLGAPQPVVPGIHSIVASAPGKASWSLTVTVPTKPDLLRVNVPSLEPAPVAPPPPQPSVVRVPVIVTLPAAAAARPPETKRSPILWRVASLGFGVLGVGALGGGAFLGLEAKSKYDSSGANGHCVGNACDATGKAAREDGMRLASNSTIAFAVGLGALGAGIVLFALTPSTTVTPTVGGASLTHRF